MSDNPAAAFGFTFLPASEVNDSRWGGGAGVSLQDSFRLYPKNRMPRKAHVWYVSWVAHDTGEGCFQAGAIGVLPEVGGRVPGEKPVWFSDTSSLMRGGAERGRGDGTGRASRVFGDRSRECFLDSAGRGRGLEWCQREESNLRPRAYESPALPLSYAGRPSQGGA